MIEKLKEVKIEELTKEEVLGHKQDVLKLNEEQIIEYLTYVLDTSYKTEEEGENDEKIEFFFDTEEFKQYFDTILSSEENE